MAKAKVLGIILMAALTMTAVESSTVSADEFTAETYPTKLTGSKDGEFQDELATTAGPLKCATTSYSATVASNTTTISLTPQFAGCTWAGFSATVDPEDCQYLVHIGSGTATEGGLDLVCTHAGELTVTSSGVGTAKCILHIPSQANIGLAKVMNIGSGATRELTIEGVMTGIDYTHTKGTGLGSCSPGTGATGSFVFKARLTGESDGGSGHIGVFLSNV